MYSQICPNDTPAVMDDVIEREYGAVRVRVRAGGVPLVRRQWLRSLLTAPYTLTLYDRHSESSRRTFSPAVVAEPDKVKVRRNVHKHPFVLCSV